MTAKSGMELPEQSPYLEKDRSHPRILAGALTLYIAVGVWTAWRHEPWADEAQSWLLARDATLRALWTRLLHYEGTPGLWHTLLHILIRLRFPYAGLNFIAAGAGIVAAWLVIRYAPLPLFIRVTLPFTYYLLYQYGVVARSYSLLPVATFGCAILYKKGARRPEAFTAMAILLAALNLDGFVLAIVIYLAFLFHITRRPPVDGRQSSIRIAASAGAFAVAAMLLAWSAWPAPDNQFVRHLNFSLDRLTTVAPALIRYAFTGEWITSAAALILSLPFLFRGGGVAVFVAATLCLCAVHWLVYVNVWHIGAILLAWLFSIWIASARTPPTPGIIAALGLVIAFQGYWAIDAVVYDWRDPYSGSREAASFLRDHTEVAQHGLYLAGFSTESLKPYFSAAELGRMTRVSEPAYWDWSSRGHGNDPLPLVLNDRFGYFIVGYKVPSERAHWGDIAAVAGFERVHHFDGGLFWRTGILEVESFDLYQRTTPAAGVHLSSSIQMADASTARQLLSGFGGVEEGAWRWSAQHFSAALQRPSGAAASGARLTLRLFIPENQIRDLGPMTLTAYVNGHSLGEQRYSSAGDAVYTRGVSSEYLRSPLAVVAFAFDKARSPSTRDDRELAAIAKSVSLESR
ncbi:MAG TPA: hypothetical protein VHZ74_04410 [Bryobacteraceae bacterium]|nr:hypothetical protein [Bryobacteraceae bacterium]